MLITLIGVTNIQLHRREIAIFISVGLTPGGFRSVAAPGRDPVRSLG
jgi:hypothetical protein